MENNSKQTEPGQHSGQSGYGSSAMEKGRREDPSSGTGKVAVKEGITDSNKDISKGDRQPDPDKGRDIKDHPGRMHTDIYINASWHGDPDNPAGPADGEYAVTNEAEVNGKVHSGYMYGAWRNISRERLYLRALLDALNRYTMACNITVHCDNTAIWSKINNGTYLNYTEDEISIILNADLVRLLQRMLGFHAISAELEAENKYTHAGMDLLKTKMKQGMVVRKEEK